MICLKIPSSKERTGSSPVSGTTCLGVNRKIFSYFFAIGKFWEHKIDEFFSSSFESALPFLISYGFRTIFREKRQSLYRARRKKNHRILFSAARKKTNIGVRLAGIAFPCSYLNTHPLSAKLIYANFDLYETFQSLKIQRAEKISAPVF